VIGPLADLNLVVVDVETNGWLEEDGELTEIGAVRLTGGQVTGEFSSLVRPRGPIPADITTLTGITDEMVGRAPQPTAALRAFLAFAADSVLVAHNAPFDLAFLRAGCTACQITWPPLAVIDTAVLARLLLHPDDVPDCRLGTLASYFMAKTTPCHRALADAKATADVLAGLLSLAAGLQPARQPRLISLAS
jgi:DNA polymerase III subunit epsilon